MGELEALTPGGGTVASVTHRGLRRARNEDAVCVITGETRGEPWAALVVCDGVSTSAQAGAAAAIAARVACDALAGYARGGETVRGAPTEAVARAVRLAHDAVCRAGLDAGGAEPPGTTLVAALVQRQRVAVGWAGDSRAYWVTASGAELLTHDHSWANEMVALGEMTEAEAMRAPNAHAITRCLGPLETLSDDGLPEPEVREVRLRAGGHVVLCTDGLWNYACAATEIAALVRAPGPGASPAEIARALVRHALASGGRDNVAVAVHAYAS